MNSSSGDDDIPEQDMLGRIFCVFLLVGWIVSSRGEGAMEPLVTIFRVAAPFVLFVTSIKGKRVFRTVVNVLSIILGVVWLVIAQQKWEPVLLLLPSSLSCVRLSVEAARRRTARRTMSLRANRRIRDAGTMLTWVLLVIIIPLLATLGIVRWFSQTSSRPVILVSGDFSTRNGFGRQVFDYLEKKKRDIASPILVDLRVDELDSHPDLTAEERDLRMAIRFHNLVGSYKPCAIIAANTSSSVLSLIDLAQKIHLPVFVVAATKDVSRIESNDSPDNKSANKSEGQNPSDMQRKGVFQLVPNNEDQARAMLTHLNAHRAARNRELKSERAKADINAPSDSALGILSAKPDGNPGPRILLIDGKIGFVGDGSLFAEDMRDRLIYQSMGGSKAVQQLRKGCLEFTCRDSSDIIRALDSGRTNRISDWVIAMYPELARTFFQNMRAMNMQGHLHYCDSAFGDWIFKESPTDNFVALPSRTPHMDAILEKQKGEPNRCVQGAFPVYAMFADEAVSIIGDHWQEYKNSSREMPFVDYLTNHVTQERGPFDHFSATNEAVTAPTLEGDSLGLTSPSRPGGFEVFLIKDRPKP